ncbi:MAG: hypothetical protein JSU96_06950, partial [Acidobacteriota bacterium]
NIAIADLDGDRKPEIMGGGFQDFTKVFSKDSGEWKLRQTDTFGWGSTDSLRAFDIDDDGKDEVARMNNSSRAADNGVTIYETSDGKLERSYNTPYGSNHVQYNIGRE